MLKDYINKFNYAYNVFAYLLFVYCGSYKPISPTSITLINSNEPHSPQLLTLFTVKYRPHALFKSNINLLNVCYGLITPTKNG